MRLGVSLLLLCAVQAQESKTYVYDVNGDRSLATETREMKSRDGKSKVETIPSINGEPAVNEQVEEKVLEDSGSVRIVERIVTSASGQRTKVRVEEKKQAGGATTVSTLRYRDDGNGTLELAEKSTRQTRNGVSETLIERPAADGALTLVEKQTGTVRKTGAETEQTVVTYRRDANGAFPEAVREISHRSERNGVAAETTDQFLEGQLNGRTVTTTRKASDGTEVSETSIYGMTAAGQTTSDQPQLREQRRVERRPASGSATVETLSIRRPALDDTRRLGEYQVVSQTVCNGCK